MSEARVLWASTAMTGFLPLLTEAQREYALHLDVDLDAGDPGWLQQVDGCGLEDGDGK